MSIFDFVLRLNGLPQDNIDRLKQASPPAAELVNMIKDNEPLITKAGALYVEAQPLLQKAVPLVQQAWEDIEKILPAAQDALALLNSKPETAPVPDAMDRQGAGGA